MIEFAAATLPASLESTSPSVAMWGIIAAMVTTVSTSLFSWLNSRHAKRDSREAKDLSQQAVSHAADNGEQIGDIKKLVNGDRTIMVAKMEKLEAIIVKMVQEKQQMIEQQRSLAEAVPSVIKVLALDDDPSFLEVVRGFLEQDPEVKFRVDTVSDPVAAKDLFMRRDHDAYLVDFKLGDMNGLDFIRGLRGASHMGPFIVLSAFVDADIETRALNEGVQMVRSKESVIRGNLGREIRFAVQAFRTAQRAKH